MSGDKRPTRADVVEVVADELPARLSEAARLDYADHITTALLNEGWIDTKPTPSDGEGTDK